MSDVEDISNTPPKPTKRRNLRVAERMKLIEDYKNGITDRYYYVSPHPKKQGEYIIRKRRTPLTYDIPSEKRKQTDTDNTPDVLTPTPSEMLKPTPPPSTPSMASGPTPSIEFFSMQSNLNANIQRELDALYEKYNKLDAKLRKERAAKREMSKSKSKQNAPDDTPKGDGLNAPPKGDDPARGHVGSANDAEVEYEYEYVDEPPQPETPQAPPPQAQPPRFPYAPYIRRQRIDIRDF